MNFRKEQTENYYLFDTTVPNIFIDEYMAAAPGDHVRVYLFAYMYLDINLLVDNNDIAKHLGLDIEDVLKAWTYWEEVGIIRKHYMDSGNTLEYEVEFLDLKSMTYANSNSYIESKPSEKFERLKDKNVATLFANIEKYFERPISGSEAQRIIDMLDRYTISPAIVDSAFQYAKKNWKKFSITSIDGLISKWVDNGVADTETLNQYLNDNDKRHNEYKLIMEAAGKKYNITPDEEKTIDVWLDEWGYEVTDILDRFKKAVGTNKPFGYVKKMLEEEHKKGDDPKLKATFVGDVYDYYEKIRQKHEREASERKTEIYQTIPEIKGLDIEIRKLSLEVPKVLLSGADNSKDKANEINMKINDLAEHRKDLLIEHGYDKNYTETQYLCIRCKDTGILDNGERCSCFTKRMEELRI